MLFLVRRTPAPVIEASSVGPLPAGTRLRRQAHAATAKSRTIKDNNAEYFVRQFANSDAATIAGTGPSFVGRSDGLQLRRRKVASCHSCLTAWPLVFQACHRSNWSSMVSRRGLGPLTVQVRPAAGIPHRLAVSDSGVALQNQSIVQLRGPVHE
jgi:hypothetical protein